MQVSNTKQLACDHNIYQPTDANFQHAALGGQDAEAIHLPLYDLLQQVPAPICFLCGPKHIFKFANVRYCQLSGQSGPDLIGKSTHELMPVFDIPDLAEKLDRAYTTGISFIAKEIRILSNQSNPGQAEERFFNLTYQPARNSNGEVDGILIHGVDVTEQVLAREQHEKLVKALALEHASLQAVMDQMTAGLILVEAPSGKPLMSNEKMSQFLQPDTQDSIGYAHFSALHPDKTSYLAQEYPLARALLHHEVIRQEEILHQRDDGSLMLLSVTATPIHDTEGNVIAAACLIQDISERQELARRKDEFISMTGHELKTPITTIKANLQLAQRRIKKLVSLADNLPAVTITKIGQVEDLIVRSLRQVDVQKRLIDDLVDASRIQANKLHFSLKICNLTYIVRNIVEDQRTLTPTRMIIFEMPQNTTITVQADEDRIGQVINNYLTNALKYSPETQPVSIGLGYENQHVQVWVQDRGPGIAQEEQHHIWERFYQIQGIVEQKGGTSTGLGLGLYICRELIQRQGGTVGVESTLGHGSRFWFTLPLAQTEEKSV